MTDFPSFPEFFRACTDHDPYPWQVRLGDHIREEGWPDAIDVPTGLGKTAALLAGVYELARQIHEGANRTVPQRILHVVDRKIVIDQTADLLEDVARRIAGGDGPLGPVREALRRLAGPWSDQPLVVAHIHGEAPDLHTWMRPTGAVILTMTTHQAVSRLLFRGLGVSERTRTLHAGLLGVDAAFVLDEPHLSHQAVDTLRAALRMQSGEPLGLPTSTLTLLGASTPPPMRLGDRIVRLDEEDLADPAARRRIEAARPVHLVESPMKDAAVVKHLLRLAGEARASSEDRRVGVIVNSVALAQRVYAELPEPPEHKALITSRFRPLDREDALLERRTVVATQTLEVGVDVSFDTLITEEAAWPALQQRLGRLNRAGEAVGPTAHVLVGEADTAPRPATAAVYGESAVRATRAHLRGRAEDGRVDLSLRAQQAAEAEVPRAAWPAAPRTATFHTGFLDTMATTFPTPLSDVPVDAFIAGPEQRQALDVLVCWREDPALAADVPPFPEEQVAVPLPALRSFLAGAKAVDVADVEAAQAASKAGGVLSARGRAQVIRHGEVLGMGALSRLQPGDELVLGAEWGGYRRDLGWAPQEKAPVDDVHLVAFARARSRGRAVAALSPAVLHAWRERTGCGEDADLAALTAALRDPEQALAEHADELPELLTRVGLEGDITVVERPSAEDARRGRPVVLLQRTPTWSSSGSSGASRTVPLQTHQVQVQQTADAAAGAAGLDAELRARVADAGRWHDQGKAHASFQAYLGNPHPGQPWAKSRRGAGNRAADRGQALSVGHPVGWRHEGLSAQLGRRAGLDDVTVHLIASHHGRSRPLLLSPAPGPGQEEDPDAAAAFPALNARFGPWGLAYLECVVRLSDWLASERPQVDPVEGETPPASSPVRRPASSPAEIPVALHGLALSPMTGWYALAGLLRAARDAGAAACVHWSGSAEAVGIPMWSGDLSPQEAAALVMCHPQWERLEEVERGLGRDGLHAKNQKVADVRDVRAAIGRAEELQAWSALSLLEDWLPSTDGKARLTLPAFPNNSTFVGRAEEARRADPDGAALAGALLDPLEGWAKGGSSGGMDHSHGDVGVTGWESMQDSRPTRPALAPAALLGMTSLGSAGAFGVGPDARGHRLLLPLPQEPQDWDQLAALTRGSREYRGWVLNGTGHKASQYATTWLTHPDRRDGNRSRMGQG